MKRSKKLMSLTTIFIEEMSRVGLEFEFDATYDKLLIEAKSLAEHLDIGHVYFINRYMDADAIRAKARTTIGSLIAGVDSNDPQIDPVAAEKIKASPAYLEHQLALRDGQ